MRKLSAMGMVPIQKQVVFLSFGAVEVNPNGNSYLTTQTSEGEVVIWVSPRADQRLSWLLSQALPAAATISCLTDCGDDKLRYWVPENAPIVPLGEDGGMRAV